MDWEPANLASRLTDKAGKNNIPFVVISKGVYEGLTDGSLKHGFNEVNKRLFKNIDFKVLGCNLIVKWSVWKQFGWYTFW